LAKALAKYKNEEVVVYALPRGGVITAVSVAKELKAPLDIIIVRKIGHPNNPEYAIGVVAEDRAQLLNEDELSTVDKHWLEAEIEKEKKEAKRRRELYLEGKAPVEASGKIAILVDDGIATGLTARLGILELKALHPKKIVVAVPVISIEAAKVIESEADELIILENPEEFLGAVGAHYLDFDQVSDEEVLSILRKYEKKYKG